MPNQTLNAFMQYVIHAYDYPDSLDPAGQMMGSMLLLEVDAEEQLQEYLRSDPYIVEGVWDKIDVRPFRKADV